MSIDSQKLVSDAFFTLASASSVKNNGVDQAIQDIIENRSEWKARDLAALREDIQINIISSIHKKGQPLPSGEILNSLYSRLLRDTGSRDYASQLVTTSKNSLTIIGFDLTEKEISLLLEKVSSDIEKLVIKTFRCAWEECSLSHLAKVKFLQIHDVYMAGLPSLPPHLEELILSNCLRLNNISQLESQKKLEILQMSHCLNITNLDPLLKLDKLSHLDVSHNRKIKKIPDWMIHRQITLVAERTRIPLNVLEKFYNQQAQCTTFKPSLLNAQTARDHNPERD